MYCNCTTIVALKARSSAMNNQRDGNLRVWAILVPLIARRRKENLLKLSERVWGLPNNFRFLNSRGNCTDLNLKFELMPFTWKLNISDFCQYFNLHLLHWVLSRVRQTSNHLLKTIIKYEQS